MNYMAIYNILISERFKVFFEKELTPHVQEKYDCSGEEWILKQIRRMFVVSKFSDS